MALDHCELSTCLGADDCKTSVGGGKKLYLLNIADIIAGDITFDTSGGDYDGAITAWTTSNAPILYEVPFLRETLTGNFAYQNPQTANARYFLNGITFSKSIISQKDLNWFYQVAGSLMVAILETRNPATDDTGTPTGENVHLVFGVGNGLEIQDNDVNTGATRDDLSGGSISLTGGEGRPPREIRPASGTIADIITALGVCAPAY